MRAGRSRRRRRTGVAGRDARSRGSACARMRRGGADPRRVGERDRRRLRRRRASTWPRSLRRPASRRRPVIAIVATLREAVGERVAPHVHLGATSQDVIDTAAMLLARRALELAARRRRGRRIGGGRAGRRTPRKPDGGAHAAAAGAGQHLRPARGGLARRPRRRPRRACARCRTKRLAVQMGGPAGTRGPQVGGARGAASSDSPSRRCLGCDQGAGRLSWPARWACSPAFWRRSPAMSCSSRRPRWASSARAGAPRAVASSSMAHKRNPVASVSVLACAARVPGLVATMLAAMPQQHDRGAGGWQAEWGTISELLTLVGSAAAWAADLLAEPRGGCRAYARARGGPRGRHRAPLTA